MKTKFLAIILTVIGGLASLFFGLEVIVYSDVEHTLGSQREHARRFVAVASKVDAFYQANGRLPSPDEFKHMDETMTINSSATPYPIERWPMPPGSYYLALWTGEWEEFYSSWNGQTTLKFDENEYYIFRSKHLTWLAAAISLLLTIAGIFLLRRKS